MFLKPQALNYKVRFLRSIIFFFIILTCSFGQTIIKEVEVTVYNTSYSNGINQGLVEAIGMVNGRSIESESLIKSSELSTSTNKDNSYYSSEEYQNQIKEKTRGVVEGYKVLSANKNSDSFYEINMLVSVSQFKKSRTANRKRIAVTDLYHRSDCCYFNQNNYNGTAVSEILSSAISNYLVQSRKFTVLDRKYQKQVAGERSLLSSGNIPNSELVKLGQQLVADYILVGTINNLNIRKNERKMLSSNTILKTIQADASINYRILDSATGQIKFSETYNSTVGDDIKFSDSNIIALEKAISNISNEIGIKILEAIYPFIIESIDGENVVIGIGGDIIKAGDMYNLIQYGDKIIDSYTKESLGRKEKIVGQVKITSVTSKMSYGKIIKNSIDNIESIFQPKTFIIRSKPQLEKKNDMKIQHDKKRKDKKKNVDDLW
jgi:curli biogenesis system outer membrane secretion channel CsgG|tara:strand:- start:2450 stop:3751 length:1302 start_codon:yes stop_codon:yes gene_type:complete